MVWIAGRTQKLHPVIDPIHVDDHDIVGLARVGHLEAEAVRSGRVAVRLQHGHVDVAELDMVAGLGAHVDLDRIVDDAAPFGPPIIDIAARLQCRGVALVHMGLGGGSIFLEQGKIADMVPMPVRRGDRLDITGLEAERFDVRLD